MRVLITGATGLIGTEIVRLCQEKDIKVNYLTTNKSKIKNSENYKGFYWNPKSQNIDHNCFNNVDAIIHLAGASVSKRWTRVYKRDILRSRKETTQLLINSLKGTKHSIKQVVSASAIGIYPDSLINYYTEDFKEINEKSFLGQVVKQWEAAVDNFSELNIGLSKIRIGLVLAKSGGALQEIKKPIIYGLGAAFGHGKQWQSWIHIHDLANMFLYVIQNNLVGVFNGVAPNPVTNQELTKAIAVTINKPLLLPNIPKFFMKLVLGEMSTLLFESQRVSSKNIEDKGFCFQYNLLQSSLKNLL